MVCAPKYNRPNILVFYGGGVGVGEEKQTQKNIERKRENNPHSPQNLQTNPPTKWICRKAN